MSSSHNDILIVGAGLAGLFLALRLAPRKCTIICPAPLGMAASSTWAQGGLAAALAPQDSPEAHAADTIAAGAGLVDPVIARLIAEDGSARVRDLLELGVPFDRTEDGQLALSLEAAHSHPRVARVAGDLAGQAIMEALTSAAQASDHIRIVENLKAIALLQAETGQITGVIARSTLDGKDTRLEARETVFCSGGSGGLYRVTTNPVEARGDGIAMAYEAGALIADPEFVQFHPTAIDINRDPAPLATEALRGEGAILVNRDGKPFMLNHDEMGELAPRDRVARAVHIEVIAGRGAYLDTRETIGAEIEHHFPTVFGTCISADIDPRKETIPVAPAAHYHMGGIVTDLWGRTTLEGLSACGECASTGAHGANRLASNSLLEAVVFASRIADRLREDTLLETADGYGEAPTDMSLDTRKSLRSQMSNHMGVVREATGLTTLHVWIGEQLNAQSTRPRGLVAAELMVIAALARKESRGGHYRSDYPEAAASTNRTYIVRGAEAPTFLDMMP